MDPRVKPEDDEAEGASRYDNADRNRHLKISPSDPHEQLVPIRVRLLDHLDLPLPRPAFQRLLALNGITNIEMLLIPDQSLHTVAGRESRAGTGLVFRHPPREIVRDTVPRFWLAVM